MKFELTLALPSVQQRIGTLERRFAGVKIIVGIDRLDYIKGMPQKLQGMETFLEEHPEWIGKAMLVQIAVPSREDVEEYQNLRSTVNEAVGRINGRFGTVESMPIHLLHRSVDFNELCALYAVSDVCLVTSTRDGMNLVSYEYIACQQQRNGVMILSEFAGAAQYVCTAHTDPSMGPSSSTHGTASLSRMPSTPPLRWMPRRAKLTQRNYSDTSRSTLRRGGGTASSKSTYDPLTQSWARRHIGSTDRI